MLLFLCLIICQTRNTTKCLVAYRSQQNLVIFHYLKKEPKHTRDEREHCLHGQNVQIFEEVLFFKLHTTVKTEKQTINWLSLCQLDAGRLAEGNGHKTDWHPCFVQLKSVLFNLVCFGPIFQHIRKFWRCALYILRPGNLLWMCRWTCH